MRVALVSPYDLGRFGGVQDQVFKLAEWLDSAGHEPRVIGPGAGPDGTVSLGPASVVNVNGAKAAIRLDPRVGAALRDVTMGVDVVHVHEPLVPAVGPIATRIAGSAIVGTFHADPSLLVRRAYRFAAPLLRRVVSRMDATTAVSPVAAGAIASFTRPVLVPNGLDVDTYPSRPGNPRRVVFLGRDDPRKGLDVLLDAWPAVREAVPDAELVVAAGDRTGDMAGATFIGSVGEQAKRELLSEAAVFCAPNLGGESFGIILVEAMAAGCAVVASALPAFAHVLGDAGALAKPADVEGLAATIIRVLESDGLRGDLQRRSAQRVRRYDRDAVLAGYLAVYESAIEAHHRR